jgi:hypothetical protein
MDRSIFKLVPWDVWAALTVAAMVLILAAFDRSPLLGFVLVGLALWAYIAIPHTPRLTYCKIQNVPSQREVRFALDQCANSAWRTEYKIVAAP